MKKLSFWVLSLTLVLLSACKSDRSDLSDLLKTVPSSAAAVIGIHIEDLLEDAGCKIDDNKIKPGKELTPFIDKMSESDKKDLQVLLDGDTGISLESAVIFYDSGRSLLTFFLYDNNKFKEFVEKQSGDSFREESGVQLMNNIAYKGNQAWVCLSSYRRIDPDGIASYASLSESQSYLQNKLAHIILESDEDIVGCGDFSALVSNAFDRSTSTMVSLFKGLLFDDVDALAFNMDFEKGEAEFELSFLNDKGKPAKYLLPAEKIDLNTVKMLGGTCNSLVALTVTPKTIDKLDKLGSAFGGGIFGKLTETLKNIDGTIAIASSGEKFSDVNGIVTTSGDVSSDVKSFISQASDTMAEEGKYLKFSKGEVSGSLSVDNVAGLLKDYCMGAVLDIKSVDGMFGMDPKVAASFSTVTIGLKPDDGGVKLKTEIKAVDQKENILISLLKALQQQ